MTVSTQLRRLEGSTVAIVGCGVIGRGWLAVFARAGARVEVFDPRPEALEHLEAWLASAEGREALGPAPGRVGVCATLEEAVGKADYVQESLIEDLGAKRAVFAQLDPAAPPGAILASSTSALDIEAFAGALPGAARCLTAHPFNPPNVLPVVEVLATRAATPDVVERAEAMLAGAGQLPVRLSRFAPGYIGNRLQAALMREALHLVKSGIADVDGIDTIMTDALAPRWAALGVFGTNHTNADGGLVEYYRRFWSSYAGLMGELAAEAPALTDADIEDLAAQTDRRLGGRSVAELCAWRDAVVARTRALRSDGPPSAG